ncbi:hypothetical protein KDA11_04445 [Candidatus Saccharibacteria bacterium]|nr:hypothetical protein [Candidatus Saccharibacteria bacterium]
MSDSPYTSTTPIEEHVTRTSELSKLYPPSPLLPDDVVKAFANGLNYGKPLVDSTSRIINDICEADTLSLGMTNAALFNSSYEERFVDTQQTIAKKEGVIRTAIKEARSSTILDRSILALSTLGYGFEMGPGNEWAVAKVGKEAISQVAQHGDIRLSSIAVGGSLAVMSLAEHTILGLAMYRNMKRFPKTISAISRSKLSTSGVLRNSSERNILTRFGNAFTVGASTVNLEDGVTDAEFISKNKGVRRTLGSAALIASGSGMIGVSVGAGVQYAINTGNQELANTLLDVASNPLPWFGLFAVTRYVDYVKNKHKNKQPLPVE